MENRGRISMKWKRWSLGSDLPTRKHKLMKRKKVKVKKYEGRWGKIWREMNNISSAIFCYGYPYTKAQIF